MPRHLSSCLREPHTVRLWENIDTPDTRLDTLSDELRNHSGVYIVYLQCLFVRPFVCWLVVV